MLLPVLGLAALAALAMAAKKPTVPALKTGAPVARTLPSGVAVPVGLPEVVLSRMAAALATGNPKEIRSEASRLRQQKQAFAANELDRAAKALGG